MSDIQALSQTLDSVNRDAARLAADLADRSRRLAQAADLASTVVNGANRVEAMRAVHALQSASRSAQQAADLLQQVAVTGRRFVSQYAGGSGAGARGAHPSPGVDLGQDASAGSFLSPAESDALQAYTGMAYEGLNSALWRGSIDDIAAIAGFSHELSAALQKMPAYTGQVIRGSNPHRPIEAYDLSRYEPGETVIENGYVSTTTNPDGLLPDFDGPIAWVIESCTGRDVSSVSNLRYEGEVLFDRFTRFVVLSREFDSSSGPHGTWIIYMEELPRG